MRWLAIALAGCTAAGTDGIDVVVRGGDYEVATPVYALIRVDEQMQPGRTLACGSGMVGADGQFEIAFHDLEQVATYRFDVVLDRNQSGACEDAADLVLFERVDGALSGGTFLAPFFADATSNAPCFTVCD